MKQVTYHPEALLEIAHAIDYYKVNAAIEIAGKFDGLVFAGIQQVLNYPHSCSFWEDTDVRRLVLPKYPYAIFYTDTDDGITLWALAHTSRRPGYWKSRLRGIRS